MPIACKLVLSQNPVFLNTIYDIPNLKRPDGIGGACLGLSFSFLPEKSSKTGRYMYICLTKNRRESRKYFAIQTRTVSLLTTFCVGREVLPFNFDIKISRLSQRSFSLKCSTPWRRRAFEARSVFAARRRARKGILFTQAEGTGWASGVSRLTHLTPSQGAPCVVRHSVRARATCQCGLRFEAWRRIGYSTGSRKKVLPLRIVKNLRILVKETLQHFFRLFLKS